MIYGAGNGPLLSKMIKNIFQQQSKYEDDLRATVSTMLQVGVVLVSHYNQVQAIPRFYIHFLVTEIHVPSVSVI